VRVANCSMLSLSLFAWLDIELCNRITDTRLMTLSFRRVCTSPYIPCNCESQKLGLLGDLARCKKARLKDSRAERALRLIAWMVTVLLAS